MEFVKKLIFIFFVILAVSCPKVQDADFTTIGLNASTNCNSIQQSEMLQFEETSPFQVTLPENIINTTTSVFYRVLKIRLTNVSLITIQNKNAIYCTTIKFISHFRYICNFLKKSHMIFPKHFFF